MFHVYTTCSKMDGTGGHYVKWNKPDTERQVPHTLSYVKLNLKSWPECWIVINRVRKGFDEWQYIKGGWIWSA
jgi:hypothetical protein